MEPLDQKAPGTEGPGLTRRSSTCWNDELVQTLTRYKRGLVRHAAQLIHRLRIDEADLDAEARSIWHSPRFVQTEVGRGELDQTDGEPLVSRARAAVRFVILRQRRKSRSIRRGGEGRSGLPATQAGPPLLKMPGL